MLEVDSKLQGMVSDDFAHIVQHLEHVLVFIGNVEGRGPKMGDAANADVRQSSIPRTKRDSPEADRLSDVCVGVRLEKSKVSPVVSYAKLVGERVCEEMGFAEDEILPAVKKLSIVAEVAAIQNWAQGAWPVAGLIQIAETSESLVFRTDIPVHAGVELPGVVNGIALDDVVVESLSAICVWLGVHLKDVLGDRVNFI